MPQNPNELTAENSALVLIDHQPGIALLTQSIDKGLLLNNVAALAAVAAALKVPTVLTTIDAGSDTMPNPIFREISEAFPDVAPIDRSTTNAWSNPDVHAAVAATGRRKLVIAGIQTEVCLAQTVLGALPGGFRGFLRQRLLGRGDGGNSRRRQAADPDGRRAPGLLGGGHRRVGARSLGVRRGQAAARPLDARRRRGALVHTHRRLVGQSPRIFGFGKSASVTNSRRTSMMLFDPHAAQSSSALVAFVHDVPLYSPREVRSFALPTRRMPLGQYQGIHRADPEGWVSPRF
jgi:nicotinamidase-related amidase